MEIKHEDLIGSYEQKRELVSQFNLMDDIFFSVVLEDNAACEYLLTALLGKRVKVLENKTQYSIRNIENHSIVLDAFVEDEDHNLYDVEIQVSDNKDHARRIRYYRTAIDWSCLEKNKKYVALPELYMIFISDFDPFDLGEIHYEIEQRIKGFDKPYSDGVHILYYNTAADDDGTDLAKLMQYLKKSDAGCEKFGALSRQVNYHKVINEGVDGMCKAVEEYAKKYYKEDIEAQKLKSKLEGKLEGRLEGKIEGKLEGERENTVKIVRGMLEKNIPFETALEYVGIDKQTYEKYVSETQQ